MRVLYITDGFLPQFFSGLLVSTDEECRFLSSAAGEAAVFARLDERSSFFYYRNRLSFALSKDGLVKNRRDNYTVYLYRNLEQSFASVIADFGPDIVVAHPSSIQVNPNARVAMYAQHAAAVVINFRSLQVFKIAGFSLDRQLLDRVGLVTNSNYMKQALIARLGLDEAQRIEVVRPIVRTERYKADCLSREYVLFVNPVIEKGLNTAIAMAKARPDIPFLFLTGWQNGKQRERALADACRPVPNIHLRDATSDMRGVYAGAKIVIIPTPNDPEIFVEAWGRVASEAHINGIPVLATEGGGLTESVGPGGILLERDLPVDAWVRALSRLWDDDDHYRNMCEQAIRYASRPEIDPLENLKRLQSYLESLV